MAIRLLPKRLIGQTIRGVRTRLGQTQDEFAAALGFADGSTVSAWENGEAQPDYGTLAKIGTMGLVDVLVFHDEAPEGDAPQLTPGEAAELNGILGEMEALLGRARAIVARAENRTVVELLEAASGRPPAPGELETDASLALHAEVTVKPRARKSTGGGTRSRAGTQTAETRSGTSREGGGRTSGGGGRSSTSKSGSSGGGDTSASGGGSKSSGRSGGSGGSSSRSKSAGGSAPRSASTTRSPRTRSRSSGSGGTGGSTPQPAD